MATTSPFMGLILPTIAVDTGLVWEQSVNADLTILDSHNHSSGNGVQIQPNGINISSSLSFNNNAATSLGAAVFTPQASYSTLLSLYTIGNNLYFTDGAANVVQITSGGFVNATASGIANGSATASFVSSVLVVNSASNTPANIQAGSILIGNVVAASNFVTLNAPSSLATNYSLTLPVHPAASGTFLTIDTSGNIGSSVVVDNSSLQVSSNVLQVKVGGIFNSALASNAVATVNIQDGSVTRTKLASLGQQISNSSGGFSTTSTSYVNVTNLSVTITTSGRPVIMQLISDNSGVSSSVGGNTQATFAFLRGGSIISEEFVGNPGGAQVNVPASSLSFIDIVSAGTYTYTVQAHGLGGNTAIVNHALLIAYEIG